MNKICCKFEAKEHDLGWFDLKGRFITFEEVKNKFNETGYDAFEYELNHCLDSETGLTNCDIVIKITEHEGNNYCQFCLVDILQLKLF